MNRDELAAMTDQELLAVDRDILGALDSCDWDGETLNSLERDRGRVQDEIVRRTS